MPGFELEPVDGGDPIPLPQGKTLLGRGPFLGVTDKRVSRNHGLLENNNGQLRIKPTHANPCFWQATPEDPPQPLEKDSWHPLHPGEIFSLLPGKYIYRVVSSKEENTQRKSRDLAEDETGKGSQEQNGLSDPVKPDTAERRIKSGSERPKAEERKRVLPAWMMQAAAIVPSPPTPKGGKRDRGKATPSQAKAPSSTQGGRRAISSGDELEEGETEHSLGKGMKRKSSNEEDDTRNEASASSVTKVRRPVRPIQAETSEESDDPERPSGSNWEPVSGTEKAAHSVNRTEGLGAKGASSQARNSQRVPCPYGKDCYRKNPIHFKECSHPGDSDYEEKPTDEDEDDRPECPYGTSCYRKNRLHKKEYRHTTDPGKGASREEKYAGLDDDSFIDDSESVDDDSDYVPYESDDSANTKKLRKTLLRK